VKCGWWLPGGKGFAADGVHAVFGEDVHQL
jgi:hypothetical protein